MRTLLNKSIELRRFHVAIALIIAFIWVRVFMNYIDMMTFNAEQFMVGISLSNINQSIKIQEMVYKDNNPNCSYLDNSDLFKSTLWSNESRWLYDAKARRLTYHVLATHYFRSNIGPEIEVNFICQEGHVTMQTNSFTWCKVAKLWGCESY